jgi:cyclophilin family peptidyl-prolyl cis-trans isomerase
MSCTLLHFAVTPDTALSPMVDGRGHSTGPENAPVTIIAFSDYQCFKCAFLAASLKQIRISHPNDVRIIYIHAPQPDRDKDNLAIQAVEAADIQGEFWEMHDLLFDKQAEWTSLIPEDFKTWVESQAASLGLDPARFHSDFEGVSVVDRLKQVNQFISGVQPFVPPLLFVNSASPYTALADFASLDTVVRLDALVERQFFSCPPWNINPMKQYIATLHTAKGDVVIQLFPDKAPLAVNNFIFLALSGWYDGITFYRVLAGNRVMTGDPSETGLGNPGYLFATEIPSDLQFDQPGMLAMDNDGAGTNGSRFFISLVPNSQWNDQYTIFGQVLNGLEILSTLSARDPTPGVVLPPGEELINITVDG